MKTSQVKMGIRELKVTEIADSVSICEEYFIIKLNMIIETHRWVPYLLEVH